MPAPLCQQRLLACAIGVLLICRHRYLPFMKIKDYIQEHGLILLTRQTGRPADRQTGRPADRQTGEARWLPPGLMDDEKRKPGTTRHFDIYANADRNHFVSLNQTRQEFRILRREIVD